MKISDLLGSTLTGLLLMISAPAMSIQPKSDLHTLTASGSNSVTDLAHGQIQHIDRSQHRIVINGTTYAFPEDSVIVHTSDPKSVQERIRMGTELRFKYEPLPAEHDIAGKITELWFATEHESQ